MRNFNVTLYVSKIKYLAAAHQIGRDIEEVKSHVDILLHTIKADMDSGFDIQVRNWASLLCELESYQVNKVDPRWFAVIAHAKNRIKSRRNNTLKQQRSITVYSAYRSYR